MRAAVGFPVLCSPMRLQILVKFFRGLFQVMNRLIKVGVGLQGENDEVSRLQWLDDDMQILVAAADSCRRLTQKLVNRLQIVQHDALVGEVKAMGVGVQGAFKLDALAIVIRKSGSNSSIHNVQQFSETSGIG
jgi:hypothetical protein